MKDNSNLLYDQLIKKFVSWANPCDDIRAVFIIGSRARNDLTADKWSDLDLVVVSRNPKRFLNDPTWVANIAQPWITFIENTPISESKELRVLFENGIDVDFVFVSPEDFEQSIFLNEVQQMLQRGIKVVLNKDKFSPQLVCSSCKNDTQNFPSEDEFINTVNDFWYHTVWTSKKLLRGELWTAKSCLDSYMKRRLLSLIEWHAYVVHGAEYDTWHDGRFLDKWADSRIVHQLKGSFAYYNKNDIERALLVTMNLFGWVALEVAKSANYSYPRLAEKKATELVKTLL